MNVFLNNIFFFSFNPHQNYCPGFLLKKTPHFGLYPAQRAAGFKAQSQGVLAELYPCVLLRHRGS